MGVGLLVSHAQLRLEGVGGHPRRSAISVTLPPCSTWKAARASAGVVEIARTAIRAHLSSAFQAVQKNNGAGRASTIHRPETLPVPSGAACITQADWPSGWQTTSASEKYRPAELCGSRERLIKRRNAGSLRAQQGRQAQLLKAVACHLRHQQRFPVQQHPRRAIGLTCAAASSRTTPPGRLSNAASEAAICNWLSRKWYITPNDRDTDGPAALAASPHGRA